jgi:hypothetical protein
LLLPGRVVQNIDGNEVNAFFRKKLFRSQATASAGLSEQNKTISNVFHIASNGRLNSTQPYQSGRLVASEIIFIIELVQTQRREYADRQR